MKKWKEKEELRNRADLGDLNKMNWFYEFFRFLNFSRVRIIRRATLIILFLFFFQTATLLIKEGNECIIIFQGTYLLFDTFNFCQKMFHATIHKPKLKLSKIDVLT